MPDRPWNVFISYAHEDTDAAKTLCDYLQRLVDQGLIRIALDRMVLAGELIHAAIRAELEAADIALFVVSNPLLNSQYIREIEAPLARRPGKIIIPVILRRCSWNETWLKDFKALPEDGRWLADHENPDDFYCNVEKGLRNRCFSPKKPADVPQLITNYDRYRDREDYRDGADVVQALWSRLRDGTRAGCRVQILYGDPGVGKTKLAHAYVNRFMSDYRVVWWVPSGPAMETEFRTLGEKLMAVYGPKPCYPAEPIAYARTWLDDANDPWLIVLDDVPRPLKETAEQPGAVHAEDYIPGGHTGHVVITSRSPFWRGIGNVFRLRPMDEGDAVALLRGDRPEVEAHRAIARELGHLPLALRQASSYIEDTGISPDSYLELLRKERLRLLKRGHPAQPLTSVIEIALQRVEGKDRDATHLFRMCSVFSGEWIPYRLLGKVPALPDWRADELASNTYDQMDLLDHLSVLAEQALISQQEDALSVHALIHELSADLLGKELCRFAIAGLRALDSTLAGENLQNARSFVSHASRLVRYRECFADPSGAVLLQRVLAKLCVAVADLAERMKVRFRASEVSDTNALFEAYASMAGDGEAWFQHARWLYTQGAYEAAKNKLERAFTMALSGSQIGVGCDLRGKIATELVREWLSQGMTERARSEVEEARAAVLRAAGSDVASIGYVLATIEMLTGEIEPASLNTASGFVPQWVPQYDLASEISARAATTP